MAALDRSSKTRSKMQAKEKLRLSLQICKDSRDSAVVAGIPKMESGHEISSWPLLFKSQVK
jgi:hypothetical protein